MKRTLITLTALFLLAGNFVSAQNNYFRITFNIGYGTLPTYTPPGADKLLSAQLAQQAFLYIKDSTNMEFRYSYAGCEKRAQAISLLLKGKNIPHYKIWNFDPSIISLFNKKQRPTVPNNTHLSPTVFWPYHVGVTLFVKNGAKTDTMVIDPAVSATLISFRQWLGLQNAPNSYYTFLDPVWYNFMSVNQFKYNGDPMPNNFPHLLTGDFAKNDGISLDSLWVEEALAVNKTAMHMINDKVDAVTAPDDPRKLAYTKLIANFDNLTAALKGKVPADFPYGAELTPYQTEFNTIRAYWKNRLAPLR